MGSSNSGRRPAHEEMKLRRGQLSSRQVSDQTGVGMRTLDWWAQKGFLDSVHHNDSEGKGSRRVWSKNAPAFVIDLAQHIGDCPYDHNSS